MTKVGKELSKYKFYKNRLLHDTGHRIDTRFCSTKLQKATKPTKLTA